MTFTSAATIKEVLRDLGALDAFDTVSAEDSARVSDLLAPVALDLSARRIVSIPDTNAVPDLYFRAFVQVLAQHAASRFGKEADPAKRQAAEESLASAARLDRSQATPLARAVLERLDALGAGTFAIDATAVSGAIQSVLDDLAGRRIAVIGNEGAATSAQTPHLVTLVANRVQPKAIDPQLVVLAEGRLRELSRLDRAAGTALARAVLERLQALDAASDTIDVTVAGAAIAPTLADLAARRVVVLANEAAVTPSYWPHVVTLVVAHCVPQAIPLPLIAQAEGELRAIARLDRTQATPLVRAILQRLEIWGAGQSTVDAIAVSAEIQPALDNLSARNVICVADEDAIADMIGVEAPLTRYIAAWLAPKPMGDVVAQAEAELRTLSRIGKGSGRMLRVDPALRPRRTLGRMC